MARDSLLLIQTELPIASFQIFSISIIQCCGKSLLNILEIPVTAYICKFLFHMTHHYQNITKMKQRIKRLS